jgi:hypothetical protein
VIFYHAAVASQTTAFKQSREDQNYGRLLFLPGDMSAGGSYVSWYIDVDKHSPPVKTSIVAINGVRDG